MERGRSGHTSTCLGALTLPSRSLPKARTSAGRGHGAAGMRLDHGGDPLPPFAVGQPDDGAVLDGGVGQQRLLDLGGVHVEAAGDDHVLGAVHDEQVVLPVEVADVAGVEPAEPEGLHGGLRILVVAGHDQGAAGHDLAALPGAEQAAAVVHDGDLHERRGPPGRR